jgi:hypothetical protein
MLWFLRDKGHFEKTVPQRLKGGCIRKNRTSGAKALLICGICGMAEAMPLSKAIVQARKEASPRG